MIRRRRYSRQVIEQAADICAIRADEMLRAWMPDPIHWPADQCTVVLSIGAGRDARDLAEAMELAVRWRVYGAGMSPADRYAEAAALLRTGWTPGDLPPPPDEEQP